MPVYNDKIEGKNKVKAMLLALALALVLFATALFKDERPRKPDGISGFRVGQNVMWQETTMSCELTVLNVMSVLPPADSGSLTLINKVCGTLTCKPTTPLVKETHKELYTCYDVDDILTRK